MAYQYYCTNCGRSVTQETVLFDMAPILTMDEATPLEILTFRLTKAELERLVNSGEFSTEGYRKCRLSLEKLISWIANENNLADNEIKKLTPKDIVDYVAPQIVENQMKPGKADNIQQTATSAETKFEKSSAILALEAKDTANKSSVYTDDAMRGTLNILKNLFLERRESNNQNGIEYVPKEHVFELRLQYEKDNTGAEVLTGYYCRYNEKVIPVQNARICPGCKKSIFKHAGVAQHRLITFIGDQKAGKTCTIVALAHYAQNALSKTSLRDGTIWKDTAPIESVSYIELVSAEKELIEDIEYYEQGIAPNKNYSESRDRAYSATFLIENEAQRGKKYLLSLIDIPGELCDKETASVKASKILNTWPVALACDAFLLCFDTTKATDEQASKMINYVCSWGNQFQELRAEQRRTTIGETGYAPVMVLFTKDKILEEGMEPATDEAKLDPFNRIARTYIFDAERQKIDANEIYTSVGNTMRRYQHLKEVYLARLRCSPFGFAAPEKGELQAKGELTEKDRFTEGNASNPDENKAVMKPKPRHIDQLMRWILSVSGCIPTDAAYHPSPDPLDLTLFMPEYNFLTRPQYRTMRPGGTGKNADVLEALSRCYLFENPGHWDQEFLKNYDRKALLRTIRIRAMLNPENE